MKWLRWYGLIRKIKKWERYQTIDVNQQKYNPMENNIRQ